VTTAASTTAGAAISVRDVSKRFKLYTDRPSDLKQLVTSMNRARYDEFWALRDISLEVPKGESFGFVGHNGSGKSTMLRLMARIHQPTTGKVTTEGRVSALLELGAGFHPELSGRENVYLNGAILGLKRRDIDAVFDDVVEFAGLQSFIDSPVKVYSSGMYVRLGFAVAVNVDPQILMIDEVIAVGDEEFQRRCMDHLYKLRREGVTIVLVSHSLGTLQNLCDRLAWLDHGQLQQVGDPADVVRSYLGKVDDAEEEKRREADPEQELDEKSRQLRHGSRELEITHFEVLDGTGQPVVMPTSGTPVVFRIHYDAHEPIDGARFNVEFQTENGIVLTGRSTGDDDVVTGVLSGPGHIDCVVDELPFHAGVLLVSIGVTDDHQMHTYDHLYQAHELRVRGETVTDTRVGGTFSRGLVALRGKWTSPVPDSGSQLLR
jgi:ABC-2 type transport system ATP-binding protein/lipopolysaccharide transport system ATP-binding protein